jgi:hypothetical protein
VDNKPYWFPVRPARNGWGWGPPLVWQGWAVLVVFFVSLVAGMIILAPLGELVLIVYGSVLGALLLAVASWKGEPQRMRDNSSP